MMLRVHLLLPAVVLCTSCRRSEPPVPLIVHVLRDPSASFAGKLRNADLQFGLMKPHLKSGKGIMVATDEGDSFPKLLRRFAESTPICLSLSHKQTYRTMSETKWERQNSSAASTLRSYRPLFRANCAKPQKCTCSFSRLIARSRDRERNRDEFLTVTLDLSA